MNPFPILKTTAKDPVCGMEVDRERPAGTHQHRGVTYYFCSRHCLERFRTDPLRYLEPGRAPEPMPAGAYTCPMHPEVIRPGPGSCPDCGMALEPKMAAREPAPSPELADMRRRFWFSLALSLPVAILAMSEMAAVRVPGAVWLQLVLATPVVLWGARPFFERGWSGALRRRPNMFTLIGMGTAVAYGYSVAAVILGERLPAAFREPGGQPAVYFEAAAVIVTLVLLGQVLELKARERTGDAIRALLDLAPKTARRIEGDLERDVPLEELRVGERLRRAEGTRAAQEALLAWQRTVNDRIVQELADGVLWVDDQERIRYASPRVVAWLGHDPTGALLSEAIPVAIAPGQERWWQSGRQLWRLKGGARDADGMWLLLLTDFAGVQRTFRQERLAALGLLLAGVAHEIRNPLAGVAQALDLLRDAESSTEREALIALADRNVARIAQMVNEVLLLGRQHPPRPQPLSLDSWLAAWLAELPAEEQKRIALLAASGERSSVAWVDPDHWRIIFENLVSNALAFASSQPEAVTIAVVETDGRIAVTVSDDGPGVAPEIEAHLFEPFVSQRSNGTGLGLYLAHELARANGGELRYQRATNGGAAFTVWLPQADAEGALRAA